MTVPADVVLLRQRLCLRRSELAPGQPLTVAGVQGPHTAFTRKLPPAGFSRVQDDAPMSGPTTDASAHLLGRPDWSLYPDKKIYQGTEIEVIEMNSRPWERSRPERRPRRFGMREGAGKGDAIGKGRRCSDELQSFSWRMRQQQQSALERLADNPRELGLEY